MTNSNSFTSHFVELRSRLLKSIVFILVIFIISYIFAEQIYNFLVEPYADAVKDDESNRRMIFTALHETFITYLKVAFFAAIFISSPIILTQIWKFVARQGENGELEFIENESKETNGLLHVRVK